MKKDCRDKKEVRQKMKCMNMKDVHYLTIKVHDYEECSLFNYFIRKYIKNKKIS